MINIPRLISGEMLINKFSFFEMEISLKQLHLDKSPNLAGFPTSFFSKVVVFSWSINDRGIRGDEEIKNILKGYQQYVITFISKK